MKKVKKSKKSPESSPVKAAYHHFHLRTDPFTTLALQAHNLDYFVGRSSLIDRLTSSIHSLSNVGIAGEPGVGKSSLMHLLYNRVPSGFHKLNIGVPVADSVYFLSELLREMLLVAPSTPGIKSKELNRYLEKETPHKNLLFSLIKSITTRSKKPFVAFVDDLEKIKDDRIGRLSRSERTLQLLEELKALLELPNLGFVIALQEEFYTKVSLVVREGAEPTVLGLFKNIILVDKFTNEELREIFSERLRRAGFQGSVDQFLEPEALTLALSMAGGNARRFLYLLSEGMYRGYARKGSRVEFQDLFDAVNEHLKLDLVCKKLLYFLAKSGRAVASNADLQAFMGLDMISIARRLEILSKARLAEVVDYADGVKVYGLPEFKSQTTTVKPLVKVASTVTGEKTYSILPENSSQD